jgi:uncharacterized protein (TIGR03083 family)
VEATSSSGRDRTTRRRHDYERHCREHLSDFRGFLTDLPDERWDEPSLCDGWRVRDVVAHLTIGRTMPVRRVVWKAARSGFRIGSMIDRESRAFADAHTTDALRATFAAETSRDPERGLARIEPRPAKLGDNVTHLYDIAVALGIETSLPADRLVAVLDALPKIGMWGSKQRARSVRLVADDLGWSHGDGPEVRGASSRLILALGGRAQVLDDLVGDGVDVLARGVAAA